MSKIGQYPTQVCSECGIAANVVTCLKKHGKRPNQLAHTVSTFHRGECDVCGEEKMVTEPRDFFYPDFDLLLGAGAILKRIVVACVRKGNGE